MVADKTGSLNDLSHGLEDSWLVRSTPDRAVRVRDLAGALNTHSASLHPGV